MLIREIMNKVKTVSPDATVKEAARIMNEFRIGSLIVVDNVGKAIGILTERDILVGVVAKGLAPDTVKVEDVMTKKIIVVEPGATLEEAADIMTRYKIKKLPVVDRGKLIGIVTATDLVTYEKELMKKVAGLLITSKPSPVGG